VLAPSLSSSEGIGYPTEAFLHKMRLTAATRKVSSSARCTTGTQAQRVRRCATDKFVSSNAPSVERARAERLVHYSFSVLIKPVIVPMIIVIR